MSRKETVDALRKKIDQVDAKIIELLNQRATFVQKIGQTKGLRNEPIYVPSRERVVLEKVTGLNSGPFPEQAIRSIYREIFSASRALEASIKVAYLGPKATFTHMAALERFGSCADLVPAASIGDVFQEVTQKRVDYGVVPIENSTEGVVTHTLDMLVEADVKICAEVSFEIHLCLLSRSGNLDDIHKIVSHPQALAQCRRWLAGHCPNIRLDEIASTGQAAQMAAQNHGVAAIASSLAGDSYGLERVAKNIEDRPNNRTRFLVIGDHMSGRSGRDKTSVVFSVKDEVGVLHRMLASFAKNKINMTKIESRPLKDKPWEYLFFLDFNGHVEEPRIRRALKQLERISIFVKILGSYPFGV